MSEAATHDQRAELAHTLERLAVRVRTSDVRDYTVHIERGVREVPCDGPWLQHECDGSMRVAITVQF